MISFYSRHFSAWYRIYIVRRNSVLVTSPMRVKGLTPMSDQDRISPYNINNMGQPKKGWDEIVSRNLGWISWYSSKLFEPKLRIVKSCQGEQTVQITTSWNTLFLKVRFKFYRIHNVEIGSNFVICHSERLTVLQQWTCFHRISYVSYLRLQISPHNSIQYEIVWELRFVHDPQQFASTWKILMKCG